MADKVAVLVAGGDGAEEREGEDRGAVAVTLLVRGEELDFIFQKTHKFLLQLEFEFIGSSVRWLVGLSNLVQSSDYPIQSNPRFISPLPSSARVGIHSPGSRYNNQDMAKTSCAEPCFKGKVRGHPFIMLAKFLGF